MNPKQSKKKNLLDRATQQVRATELSAEEGPAAARRVWQRLHNAASADPAPGDGVIRDCAGFRLLIPAFRAGTLSPARRELFQDHIGSCVECRRQLWNPAPGKTAEAGLRPPARPARLRWGLAAAAVLVVSFVLKVGVQDPLRATPVPAEMRAERVDGPLFRLQDGALVPVAQGEILPAGAVVRTGREGRAVLRLKDDSRVEMNEHSELSVKPRREGLGVSLRRGGIIIEAARQREGRRLFVLAPDCAVEVKGTVFTVNSGPKGSRVSVLEGEVWLTQKGQVTKLPPGGQALTGSNLALVPVAAEVAWSSEPERYRAFLHEISAAGRQLLDRLATVPLRYDSPLLPWLPEDTFLYAAVPNLSRDFADIGTDLHRRLQANPEVASWFARYAQENPGAPDMLELLARFRDLGSFAGDELGLAVAGTPQGDRPDFLLLAQVGDENGFRQAIRDNLLRLKSFAGQEVPVVLVEAPLAPAAAPGETLFVYAASGLAVATNSPARIARFTQAVPASFPADSPFRAQITRCYQEGVTWLVAADIGKLARAAGEQAGEASSRLTEDLGLNDMQVLLLEHKRIAGKDQVRSVLAFSRERRGIPAWLGSPAPMGALEFVSPNALAAVSFLTKEPRRIADEVLAVIEKHNPEGFLRLLDFQSAHHLSLRDDLAGPLGGEFLLALDGPVLPRPAWKLVVLVTDQARLQQAIENLVAEANLELARQGKPLLVLTPPAPGDLPFYSLARADGAAGIHYTFHDGYWLVAPQKVLLEEAVRARQSGLALPASPEFQNALPADGQPAYSALAFVNYGWLARNLGSVLPAGGDDPRQAHPADLLRSLSGSPAIGLGLSAEPDRILLTSSSLDFLNPGRAFSLLEEIRPLLDRPSSLSGGDHPGEP